MTDDERRAVAYGLIVGGAFAVIDAALGERVAISGSYALGAIVAGVLGGFRAALLTLPILFGLAVLSGIWNEDFGADVYWAHLFVLAAGGLLALGAGRLRDQVADQLARQQILTAAADLPVPGESLERTVTRVVDLLVPRYAGFAAVDAEVSGEFVRRGSRGDQPADVIVTPLRARGRRIGQLSIGKGRGGADDPSFLRVLAGRIALALDNAGLSQELVTAEQQLQAILENLGEAVTVQDRSGRLVYANGAAAELLGAASVEELLGMPPADVLGRFTTVTESGEPLDVNRLPGRVVLGGGEPEPLVVRVIDNQTGEERWRMTKSTAVHGPGGEVILAVNVIEDITDSKRAETAQRLLADASATLASSPDYERTLQQVADLAVPAFADWCSVAIADGDVLEQVAVAPSDRDADGYASRAEQVLRSGSPVLIAEAGDGPSNSLIGVPMTTAERVVGVLTFVSASGRRFGEADLELALELGRRTATAVENARLYNELEDVATTLQRGLLPPALPDVPGWNVSSLYMPAGGENDVGGDFYDVFPTAAGWMALIGDVVGRGAAAASLTAMARYTLRTAGTLAGTPTLGLGRLNDNLRERGDMALCTAAIVLLPEEGREARLVCAGHPMPYLVRGGRADPVGRTGPLLGAFEHGEWLATTVEIEPGDVLVLYTDGVIDARGTHDRFGDDRLEAALEGTTTAGEAVARIRTALAEFAGEEQDDDVAVLALHKL